MVAAQAGPGPRVRRHGAWIRCRFEATLFEGITRGETPPHLAWPRLLHLRHIDVTRKTLLRSQRLREIPDVNKHPRSECVTSRKQKLGRVESRAMVGRLEVSQVQRIAE